MKPFSIPQRRNPMENIEDRTEELPTRPGSSEPSPAGDEDPTVPGTRTEPRGDREPVQEYPGEGVRSHYPTDPATGRASESSGRAGSDESAGDEGV
jgi:hypothetical protein